MNILNLFVLLISVHFIADFPFQGDWLGTQKGKSWELMIYHCLIYAGTFVLFTPIELKYILLLFLSHLIIDPLKARYKIIKYIWQDQLLHIGVLLFIVFREIKG